MNQKRFVKIALVILVVVLVGAVGYFALSKPTDKQLTNTQGTPLPGNTTQTPPPPSQTKNPDGKPTTARVLKYSIQKTASFSFK